MLMQEEGDHSATRSENELMRRDMDRLRRCVIRDWRNNAFHQLYCRATCVKSSAGIQKVLCAG